MQTNPYEDEKSLEWVPQENRFYERESDKVYSSQQPRSLHYQEWQQNIQNPRPKIPERMPKTQALELVNVYKKRLIVASLVAFGLVSGLVAFHQAGTASFGWICVVAPTARAHVGCLWPCSCYSFIGRNIGTERSG